MSADPREERLPRWAQDELRTLRMRLSEVRGRAERAELAAGVIADRMYGIHPADPHETVHFGGIAAATDDSFSVRLDRKNPRRLLVHGGTSFAIYPQSSNSVVIDLGRMP